MIFPQYKNRFTYFLDVDLNFSLIKTNLHLYEMQICKDADLNFFFQLKTYLYSFLRYRSDFSLIHADLKYRKRLNMIVFVFVFVFVFFNSCWINLDYEWNSLLKKIFFIFFKTYKNKFDFSIVKNHFFFYHHNTDLDFYQNHFFYILQNRFGILTNLFFFFFINQNKFEFFLNIKRDFIHKQICVIWFFFYFLFTCSTYHS